jgi:hypothetical protein
MSDLRARPLDVCMADTMPFAQQWACKTTWPLADVLNNSYFLNMRQSLRAGDTMRISRFDRNDSNDRDAKALETCEVIIISSGPLAEAVEIALIGPVILLGDAPSMAAYEVRRGNAGKFRLTKGDELIQEYGSRAEADAALKQKLAA